MSGMRHDNRVNNVAQGRLATGRSDPCIFAADINRIYDDAGRNGVARPVFKKIIAPYQTAGTKNRNYNNFTGEHAGLLAAADF